MTLPEARKILLWTFIGFLSLTALVAIFSLLAHQFGETQEKVIGTTFTISAASICAMCCAAYLEKRGMNLICSAGIVISIFAALMAIIGIWCEIDEEDYWKTTGSAIVIAVACAQTFLLLIPDLAAAHRWTRTVFVVLISILSVQIIYAIWAEISDEDYYRGVAVVSILVVLMTLVIPICSKLRGQVDEKRSRLVLWKTGEGIYADESGRQFRVTGIGDEPDRPA